MSHTSWSTPASPGTASPYHLDPTPGGAPVCSPDGHWRWAGDHWELREDPESGEDPATDEDDADSLD